jgi:type IV pilus assembly protein PilO
MAGPDLNLNKLPPAAKLGVVAGMLVLVGSAYYVVVYGPLATSIQAAQGREHSLRVDLADARKAEFAYQKDLAELTQREQRQAELDKMLPSNAEYPSFLSSLQDAANASGVALAAWTPEKESTEKFYARVPMKLQLKGRFHQIAKFFYAVGHLDRIINMENISITDPTQNGDEVDVKVSVLATAFHAIKQVAASPKDKRGAAREGRK